MGPVDRPERLESAISICLLAVLFLVGAGVFIKQFRYKSGRFGIQHRLGVSLSPIGAGLAPSGFETLSETEIYNSENLYEKINGKAPFYTESGFEKLLTQRFINKDDRTLWMELFVYDMGAVKNAFSVYSTQKRADVEYFSFSIPRYHYKTSNGLYFIHGKYYVELIGSSKSTKLFRAMTQIAQEICSESVVDSDAGKLASEMVLFAKEHIEHGSIKLYLASAFGFEGLTDTFTAQYKIGGETVTAFLSKRANEEAAKRLAESYYNFLIENGAAVKKVTNEALQGKVLDFYGTTEIVFAAGLFVGGVHEAENQKSAEKLAVMLINKLNEAASANSD